MANAMFETSFESQAIRQRMREMAVDDTISDADLSDVIGKPIAKAQPALRSALRYLQNEYQFVFARVRKTGYVRLTDSNIVRAAPRRLTGIGRAVKRAARELVCADHANLNQAEQAVAINTTLVYGLIRSAASDEGQRRMAEAAPSFVGIQIKDFLSGFRTA